MRTLQLWGRLLLAAMLASYSLGVVAAEDDLELLRQQIEQMKQEYESRIEALESRLERAESRERGEVRVADEPAAAPADAREAVRTTAARTEPRRSATRVGVSDPLDPTGVRPYRVPGVSDTLGEAAFNPAISVILDGAFFRDNRRGDSFEFIEETAGFGLGGHDHGHDHGHGGGHGALRQGFNLREAEIAIQASVDPYFDALAIIAIEESGDVEIEEAYATTRALPAGLQFKFGKFLSDVGYINRQHPHDWYFVDRPLMNQLLFGDHGLQEIGGQLSWVAPTPFYTRFGLEVLQGETAGISNYLDGENLDDTGRSLKKKSGPRLFTGFAKLSPNLGYNHAMQVGAFGGYASKYQQLEEHGSRFIDADGTSWFIGTDWVYKYDGGGYLGHRNLTLQAEYMYRELDFDLFVTPRNGPHEAEALNGGYRLRQDGLYAQAVYGIAPRWQVGFRYDGVGLTNRGFVNFEGGAISPESLGASHRFSSMLTFSPTEFSRLRLQHSYGDILTADTTNLVQVRETERESFHAVMLQFIMSLGAHGAHAF